MQPMCGSGCPNAKSGFDQFSSDYENLLRDPLRDAFTSEHSLFFHARKRDLIRAWFRHRKIASRNLRYLDVGCGKGELLSLLREDFSSVAGCDPAAGMLAAADPSIETHVQQHAAKLPFASAQFDFVTAVCVYHHLPPETRPAMTREIVRVLRPGGVFCLIEHNPWNPVTRLIVSRTPVDADAILLTAAESRRMMRHAGLAITEQSYFLFLPARLYGVCGFLEALLGKFPLGGQYVVFGQKPAA